MWLKLTDADGDGALHVNMAIAICISSSVIPGNPPATRIWMPSGSCYVRETPEQIMEMMLPPQFSVEKGGIGEPLKLTPAKGISAREAMDNVVLKHG